MERNVCAFVILGLYASCYGQNTTEGTTPPSTTPTPDPFPYEHGMIWTTMHQYGNTRAAQLRHLEIYPGYENFSGLVPGIRFGNPNIHFLSVDFDYSSKCIYLYDTHLNSVAIGCGYNVEYNVSQMEFSFMHVGVSRGTVQIAVDWLSHTVYWTDSVFRWIVGAPAQKDMIDLDYYKIIVDEHLDKPDGLAVDPLEGILFWSDNGKHPKIERATTKGTERHTIIPKQNSMKSPLVSPLSMEVDIFEKRIFWIDSYTEAILSATYDGDDIFEIRKVPGANLLDIAVFRECVYVSDIRNSDVITLNKTNGPHLGKLESTTINISPETIYGIAIYGPDNQPQKDKDYCAEKKCDQLCVSKKTGAECLCSEGYHRNSSGKCEESVQDLHKALVVANETHICMADLRVFAYMDYENICKFTVIKQNKIPSTTTTVAPPETTSAASTNASTTPGVTAPTTPAPTAAPGDKIKMFEMDMENRIFFFVTANNIIYKRPIDLPIEDDAKDTVAYPSGNVTGLALDTVNKNDLYWCESDTGQIWVVNTGNKAASPILDNMQVKNVRDIMIMLDERRLAMIAGVDGDMSIATMTMDGKDSQTVVSEIQNIASFVYDREKKMFYYINGRSLYSILYGGSQQATFFQRIDSNAFHLVLYKNYLSWIYEFQTSRYKHLIRTLDTTTKTRVALGYFDNSSLVDMKILDADLQKSDVTSPCAYENGNCAQICISHYTNDKMTKLCECRLGYTLAKDGTSCISVVVEDFFILVADWTNEAIMQIDLKTNNINALPKDQNDAFMGVYFDSDTKKVIWAEYFSSQINSANLNGTDLKILSDLGNEGYAYRFDKDKTTKNVYFTAYYDSFIGVLTKDGLFKRFETDFGYEDLGDIVVHPGKGWMYFTVIGWRRSYVGRADLDGDNVVELITGDHVDYPDGLAIDFIHEHLYWSDATYDTIQRCEFDGRNCTTIVNKSTTYRDEEIRDLVTDGVYLYYSQYKRDHVIRIDLTSFDRVEVSRNPGLGKLDTLAYYSSEDKNTQPVSTGCQDRNGLGDCSTICFPTPTGRTCSCQNGVSLKGDGRTCTDIYQCTDVIRQKDMSKRNASIDVTFDESCLRHLDDVCEYKCPVDFVPIYDEPLICTNVGWNKESDFTPLCREQRCPVTIQNGVLDKSCGRKIGEKCDFKCNAGFKKRRKFAVCTKDETYHLPDEELCEPYLCTETIANGALDPSCKRTVGASCKYSCETYYTPIDKKGQAMCTSSGWKPTEGDMCRETVCDDASLPNGKVTETCMKNIGEACMYRCNQGYANTTYIAVCKNDRKWHPSDTCKAVQCPSTIPNGELLQYCDLSIGSQCNFVCNKGFAESDLYQTIRCNSSGQWNVKGKLCLESVTISQKQNQGEPISTPGAIVGIVVLVLIIIAMVAVILIMSRRTLGKPSSPYATASFKKEAGGIEIENPGYRPNDSSDKQQDDQTYSTVNPSQMQPVAFSEMVASNDHAVSNQMYDKEPLPEASEVDMKQDKTVLTHDSWLKEREMVNKF